MKRGDFHDPSDYLQAQNKLGELAQETEVQRRIADARHTQALESQVQGRRTNAIAVAALVVSLLALALSLRQTFH